MLLHRAPPVVRHHARSISFVAHFPSNMAATLSFANDSDAWLEAAAEASAVYVVAPKSTLQDGTAFTVLSNSALPLAAAFADGAIASVLAASAGASINGSMASSTVVGPGQLDTLGFVALPDECSRYYSPTHSMAVTGGLNGIGVGTGSAVVLVVLADPQYALPAVCGIARACPRYSRKTGTTSSGREVVVGVFTTAEPTQMLSPLASWPLAAEAVRNAARINDTPTADMNTAEVEAEARSALAGVPNVTVESIVGDELLENGLGAIHAVGRTSLSPPRLVVLTLTPSNPEAAAQSPIALVGKGIVYDTGASRTIGDSIQRSARQGCFHSRHPSLVSSIERR